MTALDLTSILVCPKTGAPLSLRDGVYAAERESVYYPAHDGLPILLPEEARPRAEDVSPRALAFLDEDPPRYPLHEDGAARDMWGVAMIEHLRRGATGMVSRRDDGKVGPVDARSYFAGPSELVPYERALVEATRGRVLDLATGAGKYAKAIQARGLTCVGCDVSPLSVVAALATGMHLGVVGDAWSLPFRDASFDAVFFSDVGLASPDLDRLTGLIASMRRVLVPGGTLIATSTNPRLLKSDYQDRNRAAGRYVGHYRFRLERGALSARPRDICLLEPDVLRAAAERAGFQVRAEHGDERHYGLELSL